LNNIVLINNIYGISVPGDLIIYMRSYIAIFLVLLLGACRQQPKLKATNENTLQESDVSAFHKSIGDIAVPESYKRVEVDSNSFAGWLHNVPLKKDKAVYLYNGKLKPNQSAQFAVVDISVGNKDLQQCADAVMRLRAEYLFSQKKFSEIAFVDYSGKWYKYHGGNRQLFDNYLQTVFGWCGSASLEKQLKVVNDFNKIAAGDVFVQGGFPGHAIMVVDIAINDNGNKIFMLAQGYQPAQDIHVLINPSDEELSPWYKVSDLEDVITPEWKFKKSNLMRW
jgi:hypothetical protein